MKSFRMMYSNLGLSFRETLPLMKLRGGGVEVVYQTDPKRPKLLKHWHKITNQPLLYFGPFQGVGHENLNFQRGPRLFLPQNANSQKMIMSRPNRMQRQVNIYTITLRYLKGLSKKILLLCSFGHSRFLLPMDSSRSVLKKRGCHKIILGSVCLLWIDLDRVADPVHFRADSDPKNLNFDNPIRVRILGTGIY